MFPVVPVATFVATTATSITVNKVVKEIVKHNVPGAITRLDTIQVKIGTAALSMTVASAAVATVEETARRLTKSIKRLRTKEQITPDK